ncbi:MAG: hypothetical protein IPP83_11375 [Flavobacteriales bacterium]|nr:hypothetical protein [Flavobacteriales bacterium]
MTRPIIVVECDNDELLLRLLKIPRSRIQHEGNRDEVVKYINRNDPVRYIGMVDEDPGTPRSPNRARFVRKELRNGVQEEVNGARRLVVLKPMLEGWLISAVHAAGGRMVHLDKGLSDVPSELHRQLMPRGDKRMKKVIEFLDGRKSAHLKSLRSALHIG